MAYTTIDNPELYFQVKAYAGTGSAHSQTFDGDEDMQPDLVWIKNRGSVTNHEVADSVRGVNLLLKPNDTDAEQSLATKITAFNSDGFSVGTDSNVNESSVNQVAWCWKESATAGFDILTYTGTGSDASISHSLSAIPQMIIVKTRSATDGWHVYHESMGNDKNIKLNLNAANYTSNNWKKVDPTSSVFYLKSGTYDTNIDTRTYVAYCFAEKQGFSKIGSYTGNGNADGATVWCGFSPAFVLIKSLASGVWRLWDNKRDALNPNTANFQTNASDAEYDDPAVSIDFLSNGFKLRATDSSFNGSGTSYVYYAVAEAPFVNSNGVPCNAR